MVAREHKREFLPVGQLHRVRHRRFVEALILICALFFSGPGCNSSSRPNSTESPQEAFDRAYRSYIQQSFDESRTHAQNGYRRFASSDPQWAVRFRILEAEILVFGGKSEDALALLNQLPPHIGDDLAIQVSSLRSVALAREHRFEEAQASIVKAQELCSSSPSNACGGVLRALGFLAVQRGDLKGAQLFFQQSLNFARAHGDKYLETSALLNLGFCAMRMRHFDEAIDWLQLTRKSAADLGAGIADVKAMGNLGWAYYSLGDLDQSLDWTLQAKQRAIDLDDGFDELAWEMNAGEVYATRGETDRAEQSFRQALDQARKLDSKQDISDALTVIAALGLQTDDYEKAQRYSAEALEMARADKNHANELNPLLVQGTVAARLHDKSKAEAILNALARDPAGEGSIKWESEYVLAKMYEDLGQVTPATRCYDDALSSFERARAQIAKDDLRLPYFSNASFIYQDYVQFLVARGKPDRALMLADYGRAQTLAEGLGVLRRNARFDPPSFDPRLIARQRHSTIFFYALATKQSYLWVISPESVRQFTLPPASEIDQQVQQHRKNLLGPQNLADTPNPTLFNALVAPALPILQPDQPVIIIPDGSLNALNFETLLVSAPTPHFWIEDATIVYASSLRMLGARRTRAPTPGQKLLLMGDTVVPANDYSPLQHAKIEMDMVSKHFERSAEAVLAGDQATPMAYVASEPERFSFLHFVAHGTANRLRPLDSAVILSKADTNEESYKLYARTILQHPLNAELVTISSCYGSGSRTYSGEGLVGLSWAFLRAGAQHVIGALWEVSDDSTPQLMDTLYGELAKGQSPEAALRTAKLTLLHSGTVFRRPFYWGSFQLYLGA